MDTLSSGRSTAVNQEIGKLESKWVIVHGLPMHARVSVSPAFNEDLPVVLVHGLVVSSRYMIPTAVRLAPHYRVYAPDLPGFGKSANPPHILNIAELADALAAWMEAMGLQQAALIGNSLGCQTIAHFAVRYPQNIKRAVLIGPTMDPQARTAHQQIGRWLITALYEPPSLYPILIRDFLDAGLRRMIQTLRFALEDRIEQLLPQIQVPTLVVRGSLDRVVPQRWGEEASRLLPHGWLIVIPGAAHTVNYDAPVELVRVLLPFLGDTRAR